MNTNYLLSAVVNAVNELVLLVTPQGTIMEANASALHFYGVGKEKMPSINIFSHPRPIFSLGSRRLFDICVGSLKPVQVIEKLDGRHVCFSLYPAFKELNSLNGIAIVGADISEQKKLQDELVEERNKWSATFDAIEDGICIIDLHRRIQACNRAFCKFSNQDKSVTADDTCCFHVHKIDAFHCDCPFNRMLMTRVREQRIFDGESRKILEVSDPIFNRAGELTGAVNMFRDVTKEIETTMKLQRKDHAVEEVLEKTILKEDKLKQRIAASFTNQIFPILDLLQVHVVEADLCEVLRYSLNKIAEPFAENISARHYSLSQREVNICTMVRSGMATKQIASALGTSPQTVQKQRKIIRKKLGVTNGAVNLETYLKDMALHSVG
ncbi:MAG: PAS domain S-box protein [Chitinivibrionales bacterium]|nr:PAS domain S-box protein [Chitinivibrionales bacterium]